MHKAGLILVGILSILLMGPAAGEVRSASSLSDKRVFLLYSYHPSFPTSPKIQDGLRAAFGAHRPTIDVEYMDSKRLYDATSRANFQRTLRYKLSRRDRYDIVLTADDNALDFMLEHGQDLFPGVPVVFLGVNDIPKARQQDRNPRVTGVVEASSVDETLDLIRQLLPNRPHLHVIVDGTTSGQADLQTLRGLSDRAGSTAPIPLSLQDLSWTEYRERLNTLDHDDVLLLLSAFRDREGISKSFDESLAFLVANAQVGRRASRAE
jgi:hypothetical protein